MHAAVVVESGCEGPLHSTKCFFFCLFESHQSSRSLSFLCLSMSFHCCSFLSFRDLRKTELAVLSSCAMISRMFLYVPSVRMCLCTLTYQTVIIPSSADIGVWFQPFADSEVRPWWQRKMHNVLMNLLYEAISVSLGRLEQNVLYKRRKWGWKQAPVSITSQFLNLTMLFLCLILFKRHRRCFMAEVNQIRPDLVHQARMHRNPLWKACQLGTDKD